MPEQLKASDSRRRLLVLSRRPLFAFPRVRVWIARALRPPATSRLPFRVVLAPCAPFSLWRRGVSLLPSRVVLARGALFSPVRRGVSLLSSSVVLARGALSW